MSILFRVVLIAAMFVGVTLAASHFSGDVNGVQFKNTDPVTQGR